MTGTLLAGRFKFKTEEFGTNVQARISRFDGTVFHIRGTKSRTCGVNWTSLLWTKPSTSGGGVCCLCRRLRQTFWTLIMTATIKITMLKWQHCKFDNWRGLFLFSFAVNVNEQKIIAFLTEKCYLNLRSKVCTQLRWCGKFYYSRTVARIISSRLKWYKK